MVTLLVLQCIILSSTVIHISNVQNFIGSTIGVLNFTTIKYPLHKCSWIMLRQM